MMFTRRTLFGGLFALAALPMPAIIRNPRRLMPIKRVAPLSLAQAFLVPVSDPVVFVPLRIPPGPLEPVCGHLSGDAWELLWRDPGAYVDRIAEEIFRETGGGFQGGDIKVASVQWGTFACAFPEWPE